MALTKAEYAASVSLRTLLGPLLSGSTIEDSDTLGEFKSALEIFLPSELAKSYAWWRGESLDAFRFSVARKVGPDEAEFVGLGLLISDQSWTPLHLRLRVASQDERIDWLELKLGESGSGSGGIVRTPDGAKHEAKVLHRLATRLESIDWAYAIQRGTAQHSPAAIHIDE